MKQFLSDVIDQLDLALDQLAIEERNFDRFALMIIDNVVELTLHNHAQNASFENELWSQQKEPTHDQKALHKALGQNFDAKVKFARKSGFIDDFKCESILNLHSFRNTSYHKGQRHEGILHSLAVFYFLNACEILKDFTSPYWSSGSNDVVTHRARKYLGKVDFMDHGKCYSFAFERLYEVGSYLTCNLISDLHGDMESTIAACDEDLEFISTNAPEKTNRDEIIIESQTWGIAFTDEAKKFSTINGCPDGTIHNYIEWLKNNYPWNTKKDPIPNWKNRLSSLKRESNLHIALKKYCDFIRQTDAIRSQISESALQLDSHIQQQIDYLRGK